MSKTKTYLNANLSIKELDTLDQLLMSPALEESSMDVSTLEGFLAALAIGPRAVLPSEWIPWVWDMPEGEASSGFESLDEANQALNLVMRHYNAVTHQLWNNPADFQPIYFSGDQWGAAEWCEGFLLGTQFEEEAWHALMVGQPEWFAPFMMLGTDDGIELIKPDPDGGRWMDEVVPSLEKIHAFWRERSPSRVLVRNAPKVGRNDPCPCGSGSKYKKCCATDGLRLV